MVNGILICPACGRPTLKFFGKKELYVCTSDGCECMFSADEVEVQPPLTSAGPDLSRMPSITAIPLREYTAEDNPVLKLWHACDVTELLLRFLVMVGVADVEGGGGKKARGPQRELGDRVERPTMGVWWSMSRAVASHVDAGKALAIRVRSLVHGADATLATETWLKNVRAHLGRDVLSTTGREEQRRMMAQRNGEGRPSVPGGFACYLDL